MGPINIHYAIEAQNFYSQRAQESRLSFPSTSFFPSWLHHQPLLPWTIFIFPPRLPVWESRYSFHRQSSLWHELTILRFLWFNYSGRQRNYTQHDPEATKNMEREKCHVYIIRQPIWPTGLLYPRSVPGWLLILERLLGCLPNILPKHSSRKSQSANTFQSRP